LNKFNKENRELLGDVLTFKRKGGDMGIYVGEDA
jgi:hypothetical protein